MLLLLLQLLLLLLLLPELFWFTAGLVFFRCHGGRLGLESSVVGLALGRLELERAGGTGPGGTGTSSGTGQSGASCGDC